MINQILSILKISSLALILSFGLSFAFAWTAPTVLPPDGNAPAPINVGNTTQTKIGGDICTSLGGGVCLSTVSGGGAGLPAGVAGQTLRNIGGTNWATSSLIFNNGTNVGIGTTAPLRALSVKGGGFAFQEVDGSNRAIHWGDEATNIFPITISGYSTAGSEALIFGTNTFGNASAERMRITGTGNVGIGTTAPTQKLEVNGNIYMPTDASVLITPEISTNTSYSGMRSAVGSMSDGVPWYLGVGREPGGWPISPARAVMPYPQMVLAHHTGIRLVAHGGYGGVSIYEQLNPAGTDWVSTGREVARFRDVAYGGSYFNGDIKVNGLTVGMGGGSISSNTAVGASSLLSNTGFNNTAVGLNSLKGNTGNLNTAVGTNTLTANSGGSNTAIGDTALWLNTSGVANTSVGRAANTYNTTGTHNASLGYYAATANTSGAFNTAVGANALTVNTSGGYNTALGAYTIRQAVTGASNTAVGHSALWNLMTGSNNTAVGANADVPSSSSNATAIGYQAMASASNRVRIGNTAVTQIGGQVGWSALSDARQKENVADYAHGLDFITKLRPVTFTMKEDTTKVLHSGFIAQEVEATGIPFYGLNKPANEKDFYSLSYAEFVVPLVNSVKELKAENDELSSRVEKLEAENDALLSRIEKIEEKLK